jgi:hypothetical protein
MPPGEDRRELIRKMIAARATRVSGASNHGLIAVVLIASR